MAVAGLYRRTLPSPPAVDFSSPEGKLIFTEALHNGTMEGFFKLISYFQTQSEPAYCGLATLSVVLNALAVDPGRKWKGPWRWFDESMLDCCERLEKVKAEGITFGKLACLAYCAGAQVETFRANQCSIDDFRKHVIRCASLENCHVITSYHRRPFSQTGTGHFSPIGGYHAGKDMVLILDVARFKYPPHWVPLPLLWEAMNSIDEATGHHRGFMLVSKLQRAPSLLYTLSCKTEAWVTTAKYLIDEVPLLLKSEDSNSLQKAISVILSSMPADALEFIKWVAEVRSQEDNGSSLSEEEKERLRLKEEVLQQAHDTKLFEYVREWLSSASLCHPWMREGKNISEIAANICCQGAGVLTSTIGLPKGTCCRDTTIKSLEASGKPITLVCGRVEWWGGEQNVEMLVPTCRERFDCSGGCVEFHPSTSDVLTVLLLALPPQIWSGLRDKELLEELHGLLSPDNLPGLLQVEVMHLRRQFIVLVKCQDGMMHEELHELWDS
ncbi:hypothetical protein AMTRI_Chr07g24400 [Amborella trichopoda]